MVGRIKERKPYWLNNGVTLAGRYRIEDVIDEGGFGIVYLGWDELLYTRVAIKEYFPRELAGREIDVKEISAYKGEFEQIFEKGLENFLNEARILASFNSLEGVVRVKDFFYENNTAYIIMEYVEGINVKKYVEKYGKMDSERVLEIIRPILLSLEQIHHLGLIHRDISPENLVINQEGTAYLVDFGITRPYTGSDFKTLTVFFKRGYAAEEQYRERGEQGPWTDVYAVCATMYYMLTGVTPVESAQRNIKDTLVPLTSYRKLALPENVMKAVKKGMSVEASKRYATIEQLYKALFGEKEKKAVQNKAKSKRTVIGRNVVCGGVVLGVIFFFLSGELPDKIKFSKGSTAQIETAAPEDTKNVKVPEAKTAQESLNKEKVFSEDSGDKQSNEEKEPKGEKIFKIPEMKGQKEKKAKQLYNKIGDSLIKLKIKRVYHSQIAKGRVIKQSVRAGLQYQQGDIREIVLTISRGKKVKKQFSIKATSTPARTTPVPVYTKRPEPVQTSAPKKPSAKKDSKENYAGILPY